MSNVVSAVSSRVLRSSIFGIVALASLNTGLAHATTNCVFQTSQKSMTLTASCSTDATIVIPTGLTLNGGGFKITAIDPPGGNFQGPILKNGGKAVNINNIILRTNLADVCNTDPNKVVGILMDKAAGTISGVNILINKGAGTSLCTEGVGVQVQSLPFTPAAPYLKVTVKASTLNYNQYAGVVAQGNVSLRVDTNLIKNLQGFDGPQRGVEINNGAKSFIVSNQILRTVRTPANAADPSYGVLLNAAGATTVLTNSLSYDDCAIRAIGTTKATIKGNIVRSSTYDGILVDDANGGNSLQNTIWGNDSQKNEGNGIRLMSVNGLVSKNIVKSNLVERNTLSGIVIEGTLNKIQSNTTSLNTVLDIADAGAGNLYSKNVCTTSSGAPVDCPAAP